MFQTEQLKTLIIMKKNLLLAIGLFVLLSFSNISAYSQGVVISNNVNDTPESSAMLEVKSTSKGLLIPRMTTAQRLLIAAPVSGLLVFDTDKESFYLYGQGRWIDLSSSSEIWTADGASNVYLTNPDNNVGIGTLSPTGKFVVKADASKLPSDPIFEIQDKSGVTIFSVSSEGARLYVKDMAKGVSGGFAVGQYGTVKGKSPGDQFFVVTPDSTRVYTLPVSGKSGGFAVGQYGTVKGGGTKTTFFTAPDSTRVYTDHNSGKGVSGGFAVGQYGTVKGDASTYMHMTPENYFIGHRAGYKTTPSVSPAGMYNLFFGYESAFNNTVGRYNTFIGHNSGLGQVNSTGSRNTFLGYQSGYNILSGADNVLLGYQAGYSVTTAGNNISIGAQAGYLNQNNSDNIFIGRQAGYKHLGAGVNTAINNIFIGLNAGYGDNLLGNRGNQNIFMGTEAGYANVSGDYNIFLGYQTGRSNNSGDYNVLLGNKAGYTGTGIQNSVFVGYEAGYSASGSDNIFIGTASGLDNAGDLNIFMGNNAGYNNTGESNIIIGTDAAYNKKQGDRGVFIGNNAGFWQEINNNSVFIGDYAGYGTNDGNNFTYPSTNICIGPSSGYTLGHSSSYNVLMGYEAGYNINNLSSGNILIGAWAGKNIGANSDFQTYNVIIGYQKSSTVEGSSNVMIGNGTYTTTARNISNSVHIGNLAGDQEMTSNKLYIDNSNTTTPLIYGDFSTDAIRIHGTLTFNESTDFITMPTTRGTTSGQVLATNITTGLAYWTTPSGSSASNGINIEGTTTELGGALNETTTITQGAYGMIYNLTGTGDFEVRDGSLTNFHINESGNVGIGTNAFTSAKLVVNGNSTTTYPQLELRESVANDGARVVFTNSGETTGNTSWTLYGRADDTDANSAFNIYYMNSSGLGANIITANGVGNVGIGTSSPDYKLQIAGDIAPETTTTYNLGSATLQWNNVYGTSWQKGATKSFGDKKLSNELMNHPIKVSKEDNNYIDNTSLPEYLVEKGFLLTGEMSVYNYQVNYEQQLLINQQQAQIDALKKEIEILKNK